MKCATKTRLAKNINYRIHFISCHVMSCHAMSCHVRPCHVMSRHVMSCQVNEHGTITYIKTISTK